MGMVAIGISACNSAGNNTAGEARETRKQGKTSDSVSKRPATVAIIPAREIIAGYIKIKNALADDNSKDAASAGKLFVDELVKIDSSSLPGKERKAYADLADDLKENAGHIGLSAGKIGHQREHFGVLSADMDEFVKAFGSGGQLLYKDVCPMARDGKVMAWLSEIKEIKNPYLGASMPGCGSVKETIK